MADKDPKQFRPAGQNSERRKIDADEDPLIELARIVSEDGGFYQAKAERAPTQPRAYPVVEQNRDAFSADLEAELMQELEFSLRSRQTAEAPQPPAAPESRIAEKILEPVRSARDVEYRRAPDPADDEIEPSPQVSFDEESAGESYRDDPAELLRALQQQLGGLGHTTVLSRTEQPAAAPVDPQDDDQDQSTLEYEYDETDEEQDDPRADTPALPPRGNVGAAPPAGGYQAVRASYERLISEQPRMDNPFEEPASEPPEENPFLTPLSTERFQPSRGAPGTAIDSSTHGAGNSSWDRVSAADEQYARGPALPRDQGSPSRRMPSRAEPRWLDRHSEIPIAANDDPRSGRSDIADEEDDPDMLAASEAAYGYAAEEPVGRGDARRELRSTLKDFGESLDPVAGNGNRFDDTTNGSAADYQSSPVGAEPEAPRGIASVGSSRQSKRVVGPPRSQRGRLAAGIIAAVVVVGGGLAAFLHRSDEVATGPAPVIKAETGSVKVEAQNPPAETGQTTGDVVYNRPAAGTAAPGEQIVDSAEEPKEVARVVLPSPQATSEAGVAKPLNAPPAAASASAGETVAAQSSGNVSPLGPRKVRTVIVKPDGTIVASSDASASAADFPSEPVPPISAQPAAPADPLHAKSVKTTAINAPSINDAVAPGSLIADGTGLDSQASISDGNSTTAGEQGSANVPTQAELPRPRPQRGEQQVAMAAPQGESETAAPAIPTPASTPAAAKPSGKPIDLLAGSSASGAPPARATASQPAAAAPATGGGYLVQLSSQKSQAQAESTYAGLKSKFPSVLGQYQPNIISADLGAKGVYYRVRVGPWADRADAIKVCEALKAVGGSCFIGQ